MYLTVNQETIDYKLNKQTEIDEYETIKNTEIQDLNNQINVLNMIKK